MCRLKEERLVLIKKKLFVVLCFVLLFCSVPNVNAQSTNVLYVEPDSFGFSLLQNNENMFAYDMSDYGFANRTRAYVNVLQPQTNVSGDIVPFLGQVHGLNESTLGEYQSKPLLSDWIIGSQVALPENHVYMEPGLYESLWQPLLGINGFIYNDANARQDLLLEIDIRTEYVGSNDLIPRRITLAWRFIDASRNSIYGSVPLLDSERIVDQGKGRNGWVYVSFDNGLSGERVDFTTGELSTEEVHKGFIVSPMDISDAYGTFNADYAGRDEKVTGHTSAGELILATPLEVKSRLPQFLPGLIFLFVIIGLGIVWIVNDQRKMF